MGFNGNYAVKLPYFVGCNKNKGGFIVKYCTNCGNSISSDSKFCSSCGAEQKEQELEQEKKKVKSKQEQAEAHSEKEIAEKSDPSLQKNNENRSRLKPKSTTKGSKSKSVLIFALIILIALGAVAFWQRDRLLALVSGSESVNADERFPAEQSVFPFVNGDQVGLVNKDLEIINENIGTEVSLFNNYGVAYVIDRDVENYDYQNYLIDTEGDMVTQESSSFYDQAEQAARSQSKNGVFSFLVDDMQGLTNSNGEIVRSPSYIRIDEFNGREVTTFRDLNREKRGVISESGETIIDALYDTIYILDEDLLAAKRQADDPLFLIINSDEEEVREGISGEFIQSVPSGDYILRGFGSRYSLLDNEFNVVLDSAFSSEPDISDDGNYIRIEEYREDKYVSSLFNRNSEELFVHSYSSLGLPDENGVMPYTINREYGLINLDEEIIFSKIATDDSSLTFYKLPETELYFFFDGHEQVLYNNQGETVYTSEILTQIEPLHNGDFIKIFKNRNQYGEVFWDVIDTSGTLIAAGVRSVFDTGDSLFIQEHDNFARLLSKTDGSEIISKQLEFEPVIVDGY